MMNRLLDALVGELRAVDARSVLDVGCGPGTYLNMLPPAVALRAGLDAHAASLRAAEAQIKIYGEAQQHLPILVAEEFDAVYALDFVEHLEKAEGRAMVEEMKRIAKKAVIIFTPYGYHEQHGTEDNPWQEHRSAWWIDDFQKLGFTSVNLWEHFDYGKEDHHDDAALWAVYRKGEKR